jgi:diketogulonate reductase-like aldo/keto reductase
MSGDSRRPVQDWRQRLTFGTYRKTGDALKAQLQFAAAAGFTRFDTAQLYRNEAAVGAFLSGACPPRVSRTMLHVTTKVARPEYPHVAAAKLRKSVDALSPADRLTTRVLLHRPMPCDQYRALEDAVLRGTVAEDGEHEYDNSPVIDEIGVSNYSTADLRTLLSVARVKPCVNQVEFHPFVPGARELLTFCVEHGIALQAHTVLAQAKFMSYPPLIAMAKRKGVSPAQVLLRFALDNGVDAVVNSSREDHLGELVSAASTEEWRLDALDLAEMFTWSVASVGAPHRFYSSFQRVPPVVKLSTAADVDVLVARVSDALRTDLAIVDKAEGLGSSLMENLSDTVLSLPVSFPSRTIKHDPISMQIATRCFPARGIP